MESNIQSGRNNQSGITAYPRIAKENEVQTMKYAADSKVYVEWTIEGWKVFIKDISGQVLDSKGPFPTRMGALYEAAHLAAFHQLQMDIGE